MSLFSFNSPFFKALMYPLMPKHKPESPADAKGKAQKAYQNSISDRSYNINHLLYLLEIQAMGKRLQAMEFSITYCQEPIACFYNYLPNSSSTIFFIVFISLPCL